MTRNILVTGAAGGIGGSVAELAHKLGHHVIGAHLPTSPPTGAFAAYMDWVPMDVADTPSVRTAYDQIDRMLGQGSRLDAVVHCAAIAPFGTLEFSSPDELVELVNVNTAGTLRVLQCAVPRMRAAGGGRIILLSSLWGRLSGPMVSHYAATKHAIEALADSARREFGPWGIDVVLVEPGVVATPMLGGQAKAVEARAAGLSAEESRLYGTLYKNYARLLPKAYAKAISSDAVAAHIVKLVSAKRVRARYALGPDANVLIRLAGVLPDGVLDRLFRSQLPVAEA